MPKRKTKAKSCSKTKSNPTTPPSHAQSVDPDEDPVCEWCGDRCGFVYIEFCNECQGQTAPDGCQCHMWLDSGTYVEKSPACLGDS